MLPAIERQPTAPQAGNRSATSNQASSPFARPGVGSLASILSGERIKVALATRDTPVKGRRAFESREEEPEEEEEEEEEGEGELEQKGKKQDLGEQKPEPEREREQPKESDPLEQEQEVLEPELDDVVDAIRPPPIASVSIRARNRKEKQPRRDFNERGSILTRLGDEDVAIPTNSRAPARASQQSSRPRDKGKKSAKAVKPVNVDVYIPSVVSVGNLARLLNIRLDPLRRKMIKVGMDAEASHDHLLTAEYASLLALEFNRNPVVNDEAAFDIFPPPAHSDSSTLPLRPPVVTIMGHVDHGKTTLLDTLRSTSVAKGEAGGITQHIGAFSVPVQTNGSDGSQPTITFLDTPGHAAFSAMRARGAGVTDIVVLVVAADDGIMPQTREVIELVQKEKVGLVVAINKIDKPGVDVSKVEHALLAEGVQLETFGGDIPVVHVSGMTGQGLEQLIETISAVAEMQDLRAEREGKIQGYVLESRVQKGLGAVATVLILRGCLKSSDHIISGMSHAKVRVLADSNGKTVKAAYPGMAVTVSGWKELPKAGDEVLQGTESEVKKALANRTRKAEMEATLGDMDALNQQRRNEREQREKEADAAAADEELEETSDKSEPDIKELKLVIKADVSGTVEAVAGALQGIGNNLARVRIVATGVGDVTESDVMRAKAIGGMVVGFSVIIPRPVQTTAASQQVTLLSSSIIYRLMDEVKERVIDLLPPVIEKRVSGEATVLQLFDIHLKGKQTKKVAGCRVINGVVDKNKLARVVRDGTTIHEGRLETLKQLKKDVMEVSKGVECGMGFEHFQGLREGDMIQIYQEVESRASL